MPISEYQFTLYVTRDVVTAEQVVNDIYAICELLQISKQHVEVINIHEHPERAEQDRIFAIPTLIRFHPGPPLRLIGDLSNHDKVVATLSGKALA